MIGLLKLEKCCTPSSPTKETNTSQKNLIFSYISLYLLLWQALGPDT